MKVYLTRRYLFVASHRLHNPAQSDAANREIYGKCNHPHGHGHNYFLEVTVSGPSRPIRAWSATSRLSMPPSPAKSSPASIIRI